MRPCTVGLKSDGTDDRTPGGRYATGHCPVVVYVRRTHDGTLAIYEGRSINSGTVGFFVSKAKDNKNSSGDEIANVNFCTTTTYM